MNLSSKKMFLLLILVILVVRPHALMAVERPNAETIRYWVKDAIGEDLYMDPSGIIVDVSDGIVTLSGTVENLTMKKYATKEAKKIRGVLGVVDKLRVMPSYRVDEDIARDVRRRIAHSAVIESRDIHVSCTRGTVELTGKVASWSEREEADLLTGEVRGVKNVQNFLSLSWARRRSDEAIRKDVVATLHRDVYLADLPIDVSVEDGAVILTGSVGSNYEKDRANYIRWINDVKGLKNKLQIKWWERKGTRTKTLFPTDNELCDAVTHALTLDSRLEPLDLVVKVFHGHVTLDGSVANTYQKQMAGADARNVIGIAWVTNHLGIRTVRRDDSDIRDEVTFDFSTDDALWDQKIDVKVNEGVVTLSGKVDTGYERVHATTVASRIRSVKEVVNHVRVDWTQEYADAMVNKKIWDRIKSNWLLSPVKDEIKVNVRKGVATLTGTVFNWGERREAERVALKTRGVRLVDNQLHVKGYNYPYEDWKIPDPIAPSWTYHDVDPYGS